jgi:hypothetical protein
VVVRQETEIRKRTPPQIFGDFVSLILPMTAVENLGHVVPVQSPKHLINLGIGFVARGVSGKHGFPAVRLSDRPEALSNVARRR